MPILQGLPGGPPGFSPIEPALRLNGPLLIYLGSPPRFTTLQKISRSFSGTRYRRPAHRTGTKSFLINCRRSDENGPSGTSRNTPSTIEHRPGLSSDRRRAGRSVSHIIFPLEMIATGKTDLEALVDEAVSINIITRHLGQVGTAGSSAPEGDDGLPATTHVPSPALQEVRERPLPGLISIGRDVVQGPSKLWLAELASPGLSSQTKNWCLTIARPSGQVTASESSPSSGARSRLSITIRADRPASDRPRTTRNQSLVTRA